MLCASLQLPDYSYKRRSTVRKKTSWLLVLGFVLSITLGVLWTSVSVQARTQPPVLQAQVSGGTEAPALTGTDKGPEPPPVTTPPPGACAAALCFTCGGNWPNYRTEFTLPSNTTISERGSGCSGSPSPRFDTRPYVCTSC